MPWYRAGTINLTKDSANVTGKNTKWAQSANGVMPAMILVGPDGKFYEIKNVVSDTSLVLTTSYTGATAANQAYSVITTYQGDLSQFAARWTALMTDMGASRADIYNWLTSDSATITISKDDGTKATVKTLKTFTDDQAKFATKNADGLIPINQGGTNAKDAEGIRKNAGLGTAATKNTGTSSGNVMSVGAFGLGGVATKSYDFNLVSASGLYTPGSADQPELPLTVLNASILHIQATETNSSQIWIRNAPSSPSIFYRTISGSGEVLSNWMEFYTTANTTKSSDGTLKAASPIVKIFHDGRAETNDKSAGCTVSKVGVGEYLINGCLGMNADASWGGVNGGFDIPKDRNGQALVWLDFKVKSDGSVLINTYHRTYPNSPAFARNQIDGLNEGEPVDIPADQFLLVRVEMPVDSIWNQQAINQAQAAESEPASQA